jgi:hypothetical protein
VSVARCVLNVTLGALVALAAGDLPAAWLAGQPAPLPVLPARSAPPSAGTPYGGADATLERLPLAFEPNAGQAGSAALFLARTSQGALLFARDAVMLAPRAGEPTLRLQFVGADPAARLEAVKPQRGRVSYFTGSDPAAWQAGLPLYGGLRYTELYPGIDLLYDGGGGSLKGARRRPRRDPLALRRRDGDPRRGCRRGARRPRQPGGQPGGREQRERGGAAALRQMRLPVTHQRQVQPVRGWGQLVRAHVVQRAPVAVAVLRAHVTLEVERRRAGRRAYVDRRRA